MYSARAFFVASVNFAFAVSRSPFVHAAKPSW